MKKLLILIASLFCFSGYAWYPIHSNNEFRIIGSGPADALKDLGSLGQNWKVEGQLVSLKPINKMKIGGLFSKGQKESSIGAHITYSINEYVDVTAVGDLKSLEDIGGVFVLSGKFFVKPKVLFKPFIQIDDETVGELGAIVYLKAKDSLWFHVGIGYSPKIDAKGFEKYKEHKLALIFGTSFNEKDFKKKSESSSKTL